MSHVLHCSGHELADLDIVRAQDCAIYDSSGKRYVDFEAGVWCTLLGHGHPRVDAVIREQIDRIVHIGLRYTSEIVELAAADLSGALEFADGGRDRVTALYRQLLQRGYLVGCKPAARLLRFYPPLTIDKGEIQRLLCCLSEALSG